VIKFCFLSGIHCQLVADDPVNLTPSFKVLMVCTANVCRSPAAQFFLQEHLKNHDVLVESAGVRAVDGNPADPMMTEVLIDRGIDGILQHRSRLLLPSFTTRYQLILCMERDHLLHVQALNPASMGRVKLLGHWDNQSEVEDPIGRSRKTYESSVDRIQDLTRQWAEKMIDMGIIA